MVFSIAIMKHTGWRDSICGARSHIGFCLRICHHELASKKHTEQQEHNVRPGAAHWYYLVEQHVSMLVKPNSPRHADFWVFSGQRSTLTKRESRDQINVKSTAEGWEASVPGMIPRTAIFVYTSSVLHRMNSKIQAALQCVVAEYRILLYRASRRSALS